MIQIIFVADGWGPKFGGINSFNYDLCIAVTRLLDNQHRVACVVPEASYVERENAKKCKVRLIELGDLKNPDVIIKKCMEEGICKDNQDVWWIGHDIKTGFQANEYSKYLNNNYKIQSKFAVIHHMDYEAYYAYMSCDGKKTDEKDAKQIEILSSANVVFAVGPLLLKSANDKLKMGESSKCASAFELIPGLAEIEPYNKPLEKLRVISMGRITDETDIIKQGKLSIAAYSNALKKYGTTGFFDDATMTVLGIDNKYIEEQYEIIQKEAGEISGRAVNIIPLPYTEDRAELFKRLKRHTACLMLSLHEGFGLVGWEAIAAGVPLIVGINSGLYRFLTKSSGISGVEGFFYSVDIKGSGGKKHYTKVDLETVCDKLFEIAKDPAKAKKNAIELKNKLLEYTWERTAKQFVKEILAGSSATEKVEKTGDHFINKAEDISLRIMGQKVKPSDAFRKLNFISDKDLKA